MLHLLRKDFIALKSSLWMVLFFLAVYSIVFIPKSELSMYFVGIYTAFASIFLVTNIDIKNNNHTFLVTLPVSRKHIIQAKFITAVVFMLLGVFANYGIHWIAKLAFPQFQKPDYSLLSILIPIGAVLILISIYMPLFYALNKKGTGIINIVFLITLVILSEPTAMLITLVNGEDFYNDPVMLLLPIGILLIFVASYFLTVKLFTRKDL
ncbi:ABC-2 transporter permease [Paenibacillus dakarensis]|uniref:ABC-2 transporter permease n=1 Tax=Paenibacillus dakarensis TaxID=1527293 RepID=UPI0006D55C82|nr:ABC-2 transporter permease [Paenibacillus dakarensis]